jgi:predicted DsbA family dithiol-disulfide isomerase
MDISSSVFSLLLLLSSCFIKNVAISQTDMKQQNPLLCNPTDGVCETNVSADSSASLENKNLQKPLKLIYFTDPICSACWGIEPQLRKLKLEYGYLLEIEYHMGGLLPDWSYNSGGISKPSDVAHHWDEVSNHYQMPIDGDVWLEDPLHSSYPPSIAFKAAQIQDEEKALIFLRRVREMVFIEKKNITKWEYLENAAIYVGLNVVQFKSDYENNAETLFQQDLQLSKKTGVRGFPSVFIVNTETQYEFIYGVRQYETFEEAIQKLNEDSEKLPYDTSWKGLFKKFPTLTVREFAELSGVQNGDASQELDALFKSGKLNRSECKNGYIYRSTQ